MVKKCLLVILGLGFLVGCQAPSYSLKMWLNDAYKILTYSDEKILLYWQELLNKENLEDPLDSQSAALILADILNVEKEDLVGLGFLTKEDIKNQRLIGQDEAIQLLESAKDDLSARTFFKTVTELTPKEKIQTNLSNYQQLEDAKAGLYEISGTFYQVNEQGEISSLELDEVVENLKIQTTFQPKLNETVIFPKGTVFESQTEDLHFFQNQEVQLLGSRYFHFNVAGYRVSGRIFNQGLDISLKKNDFHQMTLENQMSLSQFKVTADISINPFDDPHFLLRADYLLSDTLSLSRHQDVPISKKILESEMFSELKTRLSSLVKIAPQDNQSIELLRFSFPVPGSMENLKVDAVLSLGLLLNGEVELRFESSQHQGFQTNHGHLNQIQENKWSIEPYIDGSAELACLLSLELKLGKYLIADTSISSGIGANGLASVYYVNAKQKQVDQQQIEVSLYDIEEKLKQYEMNSESYIDCCADIQVYWFIRLGIGNAPKSLLRKCGFTYSFNPIKEHLRLLHVENHRILDHCTRNYDFIDEAKINQSFQISSYQLVLYPGNSEQLEADVQVVKWESTDESVATVNDGKVMAHQAGETKIIATDEKGNQSMCLVIVLEEDKVTFNPLVFFFLAILHKLF